MASHPAGAPEPMLPPRTEVGVIGWLHANLFSNLFNTVLTLVSGVALVLGLWFGLKWIFLLADWTVISELGGRFLLGRYNTEAACEGQNCFWRPQAALIMVSVLLGAAWGLQGNRVARTLAWLTAGVSAAFAFLPYSLETMGLDVRILLLLNLPAVPLGWALARYTPLGTGKRITILGVAIFLLTLLLMRGLPGIPFLQPVSVVYWGGLTLNLILAVGGITLSLPIGIALALGRRSNLPVVKVLCVFFIEVFRGVPLITLLFMSQTLVPLAFPEDMPQNSLFRAAVVITLFSSAYMAENIRGGLQALHPGQAEAARGPGAARLADYPAYLPAPGHPQRHTGHRGPVHRPVQGYQPGLHHRYAGRGGHWPLLHPKQPGIPAQRPGTVCIPGHRILDIHLRHVLRQRQGGRAPGRGPAVGGKEDVTSILALLLDGPRRVWRWTVFRTDYSERYSTCRGSRLRANDEFPPKLIWYSPVKVHICGAGFGRS